MTDTLVDTNVLLDVLAKDPQWFAWSSRMLADALDQGAVIINQVVYAEVAHGYREHRRTAAYAAVLRTGCEPDRSA